MLSGRASNQWLFSGFSGCFRWFGDGPTERPIALLMSANLERGWLFAPISGALGLGRFRGDGVVSIPIRSDGPTFNPAGLSGFPLSRE